MRPFMSQVESPWSTFDTSIAFRVPSFAAAWAAENSLVSCRSAADWCGMSSEPSKYRRAVTSRSIGTARSASRSPFAPRPSNPVEYCAPSDAALPWTPAFLFWESTWR